MGISRLIMLDTTLSGEELRAPFAVDAVLDLSETVYYLGGTKSDVYVYPLRFDHEWECSFGVEHNTGIHISFDRDMNAETEDTLKSIGGPFIKTVGG